MSLDFEKYVAKGVIGDLSCRSAFYQRCKLNQHSNTHSATERIDSTGRADRRGAVGKASTTERMTDTTMTILYSNDPKGATIRFYIGTIVKG